MILIKSGNHSEQHSQGQPDSQELAIVVQTLLEQMVYFTFFEVILLIFVYKMAYF